MAKAKTKTKPPATWVRMPECIAGVTLVVAPAETVVRWPGSNGGPKVRITFQYWQKIIRKLPAELRPKHGDPDTPHTIVASEAEAKAVVAKLYEFLQALYPDGVKKRKSDTMLAFTTNDDRSHYLVVEPETQSELVAEAIQNVKSNALRWPVGDDEVLVWSGLGDVHVRATADEIVFVSSEVEDDDELAALVTGKAITHGTFSFKKLMVGLSAWITVTDLRSIDSAKVAALSPYVNQPLKGTKSDNGGAIVVSAQGRYRAESGGNDWKMARWLRFVRE